MKDVKHKEYKAEQFVSRKRNRMLKLLECVFRISHLLFESNLRCKLKIKAECQDDS